MSQSSELSYGVEPWSRYRRDATALWAAHYQEFAPFHHYRLKFGPHEARYEQLDAEGKLQIIVARCGGAMVGYALVVIQRHPHYDTICGFEDSYWIAPAFRRGWNGVRLIRRSREELAKRGVTVSYWYTKEFLSVATILERLGARKCDSLYVFGLED